MEIYVENGKIRQIYVRYKVEGVLIGPENRRTRVLCDMEKRSNRPGGWTVCSKIYFNLFTPPMNFCCDIHRVRLKNEFK